MFKFVKLLDEGGSPIKARIRAEPIYGSQESALEKYLEI